MSPQHQRPHWKRPVAAAWLALGIAGIPAAVVAGASVPSKPGVAIRSASSQLALPPRAVEAVHPLVIGSLMALISALVLLADEKPPSTSASPAPTNVQQASGPHFARRRQVLLFTPEMLRKEPMTVVRNER